MVISRFGSVFIEPLLKKVSFLKFAPYKNFMIASKKDEKIELLSEVNNTYRTIVSLTILVTLIKVYNKLDDKFNIPADISAYILIVFIFFMFLYAYRKQTNYITNRINANL